MSTLFLTYCIFWAFLSCYSISSPSENYLKLIRVNTLIRELENTRSGYNFNKKSKHLFKMHFINWGCYNFFYPQCHHHSCRYHFLLCVLLAGGGRLNVLYALFNHSFCPQKFIVCLAEWIVVALVFSIYIAEKNGI